VLKILIVEDDSQLATTLKYLVEDNPRYRVVAIADDADNAVAAAQHHSPDLALGCLMKPFTAEEVHRALNLAEDKLRGRETVRPRIPQNLTFYENTSELKALEPGFIPSRPTIRTRLENWIAGSAQRLAN
jgi:CheY-like chemotaxis protein